MWSLSFTPLVPLPLLIGLAVLAALAAGAAIVLAGVMLLAAAPIFLLVIALGSAVGDAPFYPDVPLFAAMTVITTVVGINKLIDQITERWDSAARVVDGEAVAVASQGRLLPDGLALRDISPTEIKSMLRRAGISNLGQIEAAYLESGGGLSVFRRERPLPGLRIVPPRQRAAAAAAAASGRGDRRAGLLHQLRRASPRRSGAARPALPHLRQPPLDARGPGRRTRGRGRG